MPAHYANVLVPKAFKTKYRITKIPTKEELDREYAYVSNAWSDACPDDAWSDDDW